MSFANNLSRRRQFKEENLAKTKLCSFFQAGKCTRGEGCKFAHSDGELEVAPDLSKTSICVGWMKGTCRESAAQCRFAHGLHDLRNADDNHDPRQGSPPHPANIYHKDVPPPPGLAWPPGLEPMKVMPSFTVGTKDGSALPQWDLWEDDTAAGETSSDDDGSAPSPMYLPSTYLAQRSQVSHLNASIASAPWRTRQFMGHDQEFLDGYMAAMAGVY